jgi:gamma-glutamyltranspeptidase/glutathione hydrolase
MADSPRFSVGAVTAPHRAAAAAGRDVLALGGNALEALVAMAGVLAMVQPQRAGLGADATLLVREPGGRAHVIDAAGTAGTPATREAYAKVGYDELPSLGLKAALTVPAAVAGWYVALDMARAFGGKIPLADLLAPAIKLAREGFAAADPAPAHLDALCEQTGFADAFLQDGKWPERGTMLRRTKLADVLEQLAHAGLRDFYRGDIGREICAELERLGERSSAPVLRADFEKYEARVRKPLSLRMGQNLLLAAPSPTRGLGSLFAIGLHAQLETSWRHEDKMLHALAEAAKRALPLARDMAVDPATLESLPDAFLSAKTFEREKALLSPDRAKPLAFTPDFPQGACLTAIDANGLAVSCMISMGDDYGAGLVLSRTGLLLNNNGRFFSLDPQAPHVLAPKRKTPFGPSPMIATHDEGRVLALASGNVEIDTQIFARICAGQGLADALEAPRFVLQSGTGLAIEDRVDPSTLRQLEKRGHEIALSAPFSIGQAGALMRRRDGSIEGGADPRGEGAAEGF